MSILNRHYLYLIFILLTTVAHADQLQFEGFLPPEVNKAALTADYYRIYRIIAPRQRPDPTPVRIVFFMEKSTGQNDYGLPEWGGGGAVGRDLIVVPAAYKPFLDQSFAQITRHELVHIVLNRAYPGLAIPRWFHEGVAMTLSGELAFQENVVISKAIFTSRLLSLGSIDSVNLFGRNKADLAYSQSHLAVLFLIDQYGMDVIADILVKAKKMGAFWPGVYATLALTQKEFEDLLHKDILSRYQLVFLFADNYAFWVAIVFLFIAAFVVTVVRKRKKMQQMEIAEKQEMKEKTSADKEEEDDYDDELFDGEVELEEDDDEEWPEDDKK